MSENIHFYFKIYKPYGYVSQFMTNDRKAKRKKFLGMLYDFPESTMAVGRLDEKSEGLLFLTTNGAFSNTINKGNTEKEYYAQVDGVMTNEAMTTLEKGVTITVNSLEYLTKPCKAKLIEDPVLPKTHQKIRDDRHGPTSWVSITVTEGKFRQVRKMTAAVGFATLRLVRVRIGTETIEAMQSGDVMPFHPTISLTDPPF
ncbi:pseudouridine synthase [Rasiella sp. SM2506]|uniref:pseudouridine synthase n=1 Tax=Rasiella sp. SM2506 TaxID=3423914 RepID=UPI003D7B0DBF